jgi:hypothetical protein
VAADHISANGILRDGIDSAATVARMKQSLSVVKTLLMEKNLHRGLGTKEFVLAVKVWSPRNKSPAGSDS